MTRKPAGARRSGRDTWRHPGLPDLDPYVFFHRQALLVITGVAVICGFLSLLGLDTETAWWQLALRLLAAALGATALTLCVLAFRRRHPQQSRIRYTLLAIAALAAAAVLLALSR